ncbi:MAG: outer membrane porin, OprD family [Bacteroidetes bacterium]|nr:MAG: outer membrane porin, OprD family [Bacteroidota bacterium]
MKQCLLATVLLLAAQCLMAQHQELSEKPEMYKGKQAPAVDTTTLLSAFKRGHFNGHFRYFLMTTQNQTGLTDYYANAVGGGLRYETAKFYGFQFAVSGFYTFNIGSSDLGKLDTSAKQGNRYEVALFDVQDPYNKNDIDRLEEFYIKYSLKQSSLAYGRQLINTPFINLQDGRMRPTGVEGFWFEVNDIKKAKIEGGWLYAISPRGTTKWFDAAASIGVYTAGVDANGDRSQYASNLKSKGVFLLGTQFDLSPQIKLQAWDVFTQNIFNSFMLQADFLFPQQHHNTYFASAQFIRQDALNHGGNEAPAKAYFEKGGKSIAFGTRLGWKNKQWETSINYNRITAHGRYLMPREWGRDPFFTFLPRERNEGFGDVHALMGKINYSMPKIRTKAAVGVGYYKLPDVKNYRLNKYGLPSYTQMNIDVRYAFNKALTGMEAQMLVMGKAKNGETYENKRFEFNKVNMMHYSFVLNFHF